MEKLPHGKITSGPQKLLMTTMSRHFSKNYTDASYFNTYSKHEYIQQYDANNELFIEMKSVFPPLRIMHCMAWK